MGSGLPIYQPKHRPFFGTVFFVSSDPEELPWTTTKSSINEESSIWQEARREMVTVGRIITGFLDKRYTEDGTEIAPFELQSVSGDPVKMLVAAAAKQRTFKLPARAAPRLPKFNIPSTLAILSELKRTLGVQVWAARRSDDLHSSIT